MAPVKVDFILRSLKKLSASLEKKNIALKIIETPTFRDVTRPLRILATELTCDALYFNREYEVNERRRDAAVAEAFADTGIAVKTFTDQCAFEPGELRTGANKFYTVYTPFKRAWFRAFNKDHDRHKPLGLPKKQSDMVSRPDEIPKEVHGFKSNPGQSILWPTGEQIAKRKLNQFIAQQISSYKDARDYPMIDGTSTLSPYLASGVLSQRRCLDAAIIANAGQAATGSEGVVQWISELIWREFYKHILIGFPRVSMHRAFKPATEHIVWNNSPNHFQAWCDGKTGYPIVDAAMRQLTQTGWMHNRLRMIVAMFLSKNLFLDWRCGERFFMQKLVDGDLSANNGGWQWAASTGTDSVPYFRVFNPCAQSKRFDPDAVFIRRFVPELAHVDVPLIHDPSRLSDTKLKTIGYPKTIVDHAATRRSAIAAFKALKDEPLC